MPAPKAATGGVSRSKNMHEDIHAECRVLRAQLAQEEQARREAQRLQAPLLDELREAAARLARAEEALREAQTKGDEARRAELRSRLGARTENVEHSLQEETLRETKAVVERACEQRMSEALEARLRARESVWAEEHQEQLRARTRAHEDELRGRLQALQRGCEEKLQETQSVHEEALKARERRYADGLQEARAAHAEELLAKERAFAKQLRMVEEKHAEDTERRQRECDNALREALRAKQNLVEQPSTAQQRGTHSRGSSCANTQTSPPPAEKKEKMQLQEVPSKRCVKNQAVEENANKRPCARKSGPPERPRWLPTAPRATVETSAQEDDPDYDPFNTVPDESSKA